MNHDMAHCADFGCIQAGLQGEERDMSKYIIEIEEKPLCVFDKDTQTYFPRLWRVKGFNSLVFDEEGLSRLEELNSDYISEHFGDLQDTAYQKGLHDGESKCRYCNEYQRGFEDGKKEAESSEAIVQVRMDAFNKGMHSKEELIHDAFLRGVETGKAVNDRGCEGCQFEGIEIYLRPCSACRNAYPNQWTAKQTDDKIKVRDEVVWTEDENVVIVVTSVYTNDGNVEWCDGVCKDGKAYSILTKNARKTGRHFDIDKYLEEINRSKTDDVC